MAYRSIDPYTGAGGILYPEMSDSEMEAVLTKSQEVFKIWSRSGLDKRALLVSRLGEILEAESDHFADIITSEMGKPVKQARAELLKCASACNYYSVNGKKFLSSREMESPGSKSYLRFDPLGIVLAVMPWNFPFWQVIRCIVPAMLAGNSVLLKHASNVPGSALAIEDAVRRAGFPEGLFRNLFVSHRQVDSLLSHPAVRSVSLTGSNYAGEKVASAAGANIKKCVLELGGSDPLIVFPDADIGNAVEGAVAGRFQNNGQSCIATKRIFLHSDIYDQFIDLFTRRVEALVMGDPKIESTDIGPMVNRAAAEELAGQVEKSIRMGAEIICGRGIPEGESCFFRPTVLVNVPYNSPLATEETFGPVVPVFRFSDYDEMIERVNSSRFGLGASAWTNDMELARKTARDIESGTVTINGFTRSDPALPFGGVKDSGFGRELSDTGLYEFVNIKTVSLF